MITGHPQIALLCIIDIRVRDHLRNSGKQNLSREEEKTSAKRKTSPRVNLRNIGRKCGEKWRNKEIAGTDMGQSSMTGQKVNRTAKVKVLRSRKVVTIIPSNEKWI